LTTTRPAARILPGGEAVGYVPEFADGFKAYDAGDITVLGEWRTIGN